MNYTYKSFAEMKESLLPLFRLLMTGNSKSTCSHDGSMIFRFFTFDQFIYWFLLRSAKDEDSHNLLNELLREEHLERI